MTENKQGPSPTEIKGRKRKIPEFLSRRWWAGVGVLAGITISIIALVVSGGFGREVGCSRQIPQQSEEPSTEYREHPSPSEITDEIRRQPLFQQDKAGDYYIGLKVQWHLKLAIVYSTNSDSNITKIGLTGESNMHPYVNCNIDIREYPEIKTVKGGTGVFVKGEISRVELSSIDLINCIVEFD